MSIFVEGIYDNKQYLTPDELVIIKETMETFFESWKKSYTDDMLHILDTTPYEVPVSNPFTEDAMYIRNILAKDEDTGQRKYDLLSFELYDKIKTIIEVLYRDYREDIAIKIINYINDQNNNFKRRFSSKDNCPDLTSSACSLKLYELITFLFFVDFILQSHNNSKYAPGSEFAKDLEDKFNERNPWFHPKGGRKLKRPKRSKRSKRQKRSKKNRKSKNKSRR